MGEEVGEDEDNKSGNFANRKRKWMGGGEEEDGRVDLLAFDAKQSIMQESKETVRQRCIHERDTYLSHS